MCSSHGVVSIYYHSCQLTSSRLGSSVGGAHRTEHHGGGGAHHAEEGRVDWLVSHRTESDFREDKICILESLNRENAPPLKIINTLYT